MTDLARQNEAAQCWLDSLSASGRAHSTVRHHQRLLSMLFEYLTVEGGLTPAEVEFRAVVPIYGQGVLLGKGPVNPLFVERFLSWACREADDRERAAKMRNDLLETLHLFFRSLVAGEKLGADPTPKVPRARTRVRVNHRKYLTPVESAELLDAAGNSGKHAPRNLTIVLLLLRAGLRPSEACGLTAAGIDLAQGLLLVTGKTGSRSVPLVPTAQQVLERYLGSAYFRSRRLASGDLFPNDAGTAPLKTAGLRSLIRQLCDLAGIDKAVTTYWLRHTFATDAHRSGVEFPIRSEERRGG